MATKWLQNFQRINVTFKIGGINAQNANQKYVKTPPVKVIDLSGSKRKNPRNPHKQWIFGDYFLRLSTF